MSTITAPLYTSTTTITITPYTPTTPLPCTVPCEPTVTLPSTPLGVFHLLFIPTLINIICEQSNLYAQQVLSDNAYQHFDQITPTEIQAYFGFMILMGINQLPCLYDYWKLDTTYHCSPIAN